jgi:hypothetical protein
MNPTARATTFTAANAGTKLGGGFYFGNLTYGGKTYALVMAQQGYFPWFPGAQVAVYTSYFNVNNLDDFDGFANTAAMLADTSNFPAAARIKSINDANLNGFNDWYIASEEETKVLLNNQDKLPSYNSIRGGIPGIVSVTTSTRVASNSGTMIVFLVQTDNSIFFGTSDGTNPWHVLPIRRIQIS